MKIKREYSVSIFLLFLKKIAKLEKKTENISPHCDSDFSLVEIFSTIF